MDGRRGADREDRAVMQRWGTCSNCISTGQQRRGDSRWGYNLSGDDRQDGCDDGKKAERGQAGGGLTGAGFWPRDQNSLQMAALVKETQVDGVWREIEGSLSHFSAFGHGDERHDAVYLGQDIGW